MRILIYMNLKQTNQDKDPLQEEQKFKTKTCYRVSNSSHRLSMDNKSQIETSQKLRILVEKISQVLTNNLGFQVVPWAQISRKAWQPLDQPGTASILQVIKKMEETLLQLILSMPQVREMEKSPLWQYKVHRCPSQMVQGLSLIWIRYRPR